MRSRSARRARGARCVGSGPREVHGPESVERRGSALLAWALPACRSAASRCFRLLCARGRLDSRAPLVGSRPLQGSSRSPPSARHSHGSVLSSGRASFGGRRPSWALLPYSACGGGDPVHAGPATAPATFRPRRFDALAGLLPPRPCRTFDRRRSWDWTFRVLFLPGIRAALAAWSSRAVSPRAVTRRRAHARSPASEGCSPRESAPCTNLRPHAADTLLVLTPLGLSSPPPQTRLPGPSSLALPFASLAVRARGASESSLAEDPAFPATRGARGVSNHGCRPFRGSSPRHRLRPFDRDRVSATS